MSQRTEISILVIDGHPIDTSVCILPVAESDEEFVPYNDEELNRFTWHHIDWYVA